jgi:cobalamin synthase
MRKHIFMVERSNCPENIGGNSNDPRFFHRNDAMTARILWLTVAALVTLAFGFKGALAALAALAIAGAWHRYHARRATP